MTDYQLIFWLVGAGVIEIAAVLVAIFVVFPSENNWHWMLRWGFALLTHGLTVQIIRTVYFLQHGHYPADVFFPQWITKDLGASLLLFYFAFVHPKKG